MDEQKLSQQEMQESRLLKENDNLVHNCSQDLDAEEAFISTTDHPQGECGKLNVGILEDHSDVTQKILASGEQECSQASALESLPSSNLSKVTMHDTVDTHVEENRVDETHGRTRVITEASLASCQDATHTNPDTKQQSNGREGLDADQKLYHSGVVTHIQSTTAVEKQQEDVGQDIKIDDEMQETKEQEFTEIVPMEVNSIDNLKTTEVANKNSQEQKVQPTEIISTAVENQQEDVGQDIKIDDEMQETKEQEFTEIVPMEVNSIDNLKTTEVANKNSQEQKVQPTEIISTAVEKQQEDVGQDMKIDDEMQETKEQEFTEIVPMEVNSIDNLKTTEVANKNSQEQRVQPTEILLISENALDSKKVDVFENNQNVESDTKSQSDSKQGSQLENQRMELELKLQSDSKQSNQLRNQSTECDMKLQSDNKQSSELGNRNVNEGTQSQQNKPKEPNKNPSQGKQNQEPQTKKQKSGVVNENFERINYLVQTSHALVNMGASNNESASLDFDRTLASQTGSLAMAVGRRCLIRLTPSLKRMLCKGCGTSLIYGVNARVRHRSKRQKHFVITCLTCNTIKRLVNDPNHTPWCEREEALL